MPNQTVIYGLSEKNNAYPLEMDDYTGGLQTIDVSHHHIHEGDAFSYIDSISLNSAGVQNYLITAPNSTYLTNITIQVDSTFLVTIAFYEASDRTGTTAETPFNRNRNSATTSRTAVHKGIEGGTTDGSLLFTETIGTSASGAKIGGSSRNDEEIILKKNTKYILRVTSGANSNRINLILSYYEHPDFY